MWWAVVSVLGVILAIWLAHWQAHKAEWKTAVMRLYQERSHQLPEAVTAQQLKAWADQHDEQQWRVRAVRIQAKPLLQPVFQWTAFQGQWGRCLYGVVELESGYGMVVKLGWLPDPLMQTTVVRWPEPWLSRSLTADVSEWKGHLQSIEHRFRLQSKGVLPQPGKALALIELEAMEQAYHLRLFPGVLELSGETQLGQSEGCAIQPPSNEEIQKHRSYQYQWYAIAVLIAVLYGYYGYSRSSKSE
jgi:cytochrome oxidase assembly protein ShyY1